MAEQLCFECGNPATEGQGLVWDSDGLLTHNHFPGVADVDSLSDQEMEEAHVRCPALPEGWSGCRRCYRAQVTSLMFPGDEHWDFARGFTYHPRGGDRAFWLRVGEHESLPPAMLAGTHGVIRECWICSICATVLPGEWSANRRATISAAREGAQDEDRVLEFLEGEPEGKAYRKRILHGAFTGHRSPDQISALRDRMVAAGQIATERVTTGGPPAEEWRRT
jgi:hypothetical protein